MANGQLTTTRYASWGISSGMAVTSTVDGVVTDFDVNVEPVLAAEQNEEGSVIGQVRYDNHLSGNATVQVKSSSTLPNIGDTINIASSESGQVSVSTYYITSLRVVENNTSFRKIVVGLEAYYLCGETSPTSGLGGNNEG